MPGTKKSNGPVNVLVLDSICASAPPTLSRVDKQIYSKVQVLKISYATLCKGNDLLYPKIPENGLLAAGLLQFGKLLGGLLDM